MLVAGAAAVAALTLLILAAMVVAGGWQRMARETGLYLAVVSGMFGLAALVLLVAGVLLPR